MSQKERTPSGSIPISQKRTKDEMSKRSSKNLSDSESRDSAFHLDFSSNSRSPSISPSCSPPRKVHAPSILEKNILQGDQEARNLSLAHAIATDNDLEIQTSELIDPTDPTSEKIEYDGGAGNNLILEHLQEIYWKNMQEKLGKSENDDTIKMNLTEWFEVIQPIKEIKTKVFDLLPKKKVTSMHTQLEERLDIKILEQQIDCETFDLNEFKKYLCLIIDTMAKICAPVRDDKIGALRQQLAACQIWTITVLLNDVNKLLKLMSIDMANFSIKAIRPYLQKQQVEYERKKMVEYLKQNPKNGLLHTKAWLGTAFRNIMLQQSNDDKNMPISPVGPNKVLDTAFFTLLTNPPSNEMSYYWPETVLLDREKIIYLYKVHQNLSILTGIIFVSNQILSKIQKSRQLSYTVCKNLMANLQNELLVLLDENKQNSNIFIDSIESHVKKSFVSALKTSENNEIDILDSDPMIKTFFGQISEILRNKNQKIRVLFQKRLSKYVQEVCDNTTANMYKMPGSQSSNEEDSSPKIPNNLTFISNHVAKLASNFTQLVILNKTIHGPFYSGVIKEIYEEHNNEITRLKTVNEKQSCSQNQDILFTPRKNKELDHLDDVGESVNLVKKQLTFDELDVD